MWRSAVLLPTALLTACSSQPAAPTCGAGPDGCLTLLRQSDTVIVGEVVDTRRPGVDLSRGEPGTTSFEESDVRVEVYLAGTRERTTLTVRVPTSHVTSGGVGMPARDPRLRAGERTLLFLDQVESEGSNNTYQIVQASVPEIPLLFGKLDIDGDLAKNANLGDAPWERLDTITARIVAQSQEIPTCGRELGFCDELAAASDVVILGHVLGPRPEFEVAPATAERRALTFQDFTAAVERVVNGDLDADEVMVRTFGWEIREDGSPVPPIYDADLSPDEHVLLFLTRDHDANTELGPETFTIVARGLAYGALRIRGGIARTWIFSPTMRGVPEPIDVILETVTDPR